MTEPSPLAVPFFVAAGLLVVAGGVKLARPEGAARAMAIARLPHGRLPVRSIALAEVGIGAACLVRPGPIAAGAMAALYLGFAGFLAYLIAAGVPSASCGCLGDRETPPSRIHAVLNLLASASAMIAAIRPPAGVVDLALDLPLRGLGFVVGGLCAGYLAYLTVSLLPEVLRRK